MPDLPVLPSREVVRVLASLDFQVVSSRGGHVKLRGRRAGRPISIVVPEDTEVSRSVLASILRRAGMNREDFLDLV